MYYEFVCFSLRGRGLGVYIANMGLFWTPNYKFFGKVG